MAEKFQRKVEGELAAGSYQSVCRKSWADFVIEYKAKILPRQAPRTQRVTESAIEHFERIVKPAKAGTIRTQDIDNYVAVRQTEDGKKPKSKVSPATINRELRHLKSILRIAHEWGYLPVVPKLRKLREDQRIGAVITPEHFQAIYEACDNATMPRGLACAHGDWWRGLLTFAITTGWRIDEILSFRRDDFDRTTGAITTRAADNKGSRDDMDYLPPAALELVKLVAGFGTFVFEWPHNDRLLWDEFKRIQKAAGVKLVCQRAREHECTDACDYYGFHALRRGYATLNAERLPAAVLQKKMRHKSFTTTLRYIGLADKMKKSADQVYVPEFLKTASG